MLVGGFVHDVCNICYIMYILCMFDVCYGFSCVCVCLYARVYLCMGVANAM